jgi:hypothetical protein
MVTTQFLSGEKQETWSGKLKRDLIKFSGEDKNDNEVTMQRV